MEAGFDISDPARSVPPPGQSTAHANAGVVLIVDDEEELAREIIAPHFEAHWRIRFAHTLSDGLAAVDDIDCLCAALVDLHLPPGTLPQTRGQKSLGFEIAERARRKFPSTPVVIFSGYVNPAYVNTAHRLGAEYLVKGDSTADLQRLACRFLLQAHPQPCRANAYVARLRDDHRLSHRQTQVVTLALRGLQNNEIADALGISVNTLKRHVAAALEKCGEPSLSAITRRFLRGE